MGTPYYYYNNIANPHLDTVSVVEETRTRPKGV